MLRLLFQDMWCDELLFFSLLSFENVHLFFLTVFSEMESEVSHGSTTEACWNILNQHTSSIPLSPSKWNACNLALVWYGVCILPGVMSVPKHSSLWKVRWMTIHLCHFLWLADFELSLGAGKGVSLVILICDVFYSSKHIWAHENVQYSLRTCYSDFIHIHTCHKHTIPSREHSEQGTCTYACYACWVALVEPRHLHDSGSHSMLSPLPVHIGGDRT